MVEKNQTNGYFYEVWSKISKLKIRFKNFLDENSKFKWRYVHICATYIMKR